jgi:hypothetical protein
LQIGPLHERDAPIIPVKQLYFVWGGSTFPRSSRRHLWPFFGSFVQSTVRYLGIEVDDTLAIAEQVDV